MDVKVYHALEPPLIGNTVGTLTILVGSYGDNPFQISSTKTFRGKASVGFRKHLCPIRCRLRDQ